MTNSRSSSRKAPGSGRLSQQHPGTSCHKKRALIISGDFLVRWHLEGTPAPVLDGRWLFLPQGYQNIWWHQHLEEGTPLLNRVGGKSHRNPVLGWEMDDGGGDDLTPIAWCWGVSATHVQLVCWWVISCSAGHYWDKLVSWS